MFFSSEFLINFHPLAIRTKIIKQLLFTSFVEKLVEGVVIQESCYNSNIQRLSSDSSTIKLAITACISTVL